MSPLCIISTFFLLVWLENILGISEKSNVLDRYLNKSQKSKLQKMSQITRIHPTSMQTYTRWGLWITSGDNTMDFYSNFIH